MQQSLKIPLIFWWALDCSGENPYTVYILYSYVTRSGKIRHFQSKFEILLIYLASYNVCVTRLLSTCMSIYNCTVSELQHFVMQPLILPVLRAVKFHVRMLTIEKYSKCWIFADPATYMYIYYKKLYYCPLRFIMVVWGPSREIAASALSCSLLWRKHCLCNNRGMYCTCIIMCVYVHVYTVQIRCKV